MWRSTLRADSYSYMHKVTYAREFCSSDTTAAKIKPRKCFDRRIHLPGKLASAVILFRRMSAVVSAKAIRLARATGQNSADPFSESNKNGYVTRRKPATSLLLNGSCTV